MNQGTRLRRNAGTEDYSFIRFPITQAFGTTDDDANAMTHEDALQSLTRLSYLIYDIKGTY